MVFCPQPKPKTDRDPKYLAYVRTFTCYVPLCWRDSAAHHESGISSEPAMAKKCSDYFALPLCIYHHDRRNTMGFETFYRHYVMDPHVIVRELLRGYKKLHPDRIFPYQIILDSFC